MDMLVRRAVKGDVKAQEMLDDIKDRGENAPHKGGTYYNKAGCVGKLVKKATFAKKAYQKKPTMQEVVDYNKKLLDENHNLLDENDKLLYANHLLPDQNDKLKKLLACIHHVCIVC